MRCHSNSLFIKPPINIKCKRELLQFFSEENNLVLSSKKSRPSCGPLFISIFIQIFLLLNPLFLFG